MNWCILIAYFFTQDCTNLFSISTNTYKLQKTFFSSWMRIGLTSVHSFTVLYFTTHKRLKHAKERRSNSHVGSKLYYSKPCNIFVISSKKWEEGKRKWELFPTLIQNACILECFFGRQEIFYDNIFCLIFLAQGM